MSKHGYRTSPQIISELQRIANENSGLLLAEDVVESARDKRSVLHNSFTWDDSEAANQYRLEQARKLIRTTVRWIEIDGDKRPVRVFVSLTPDRDEESGGYRDVVVVLSDKNMRRQMLEDALNELQLFEKKYAHLKELTHVFTASKRAREELVAKWGQVAA
jgi:hypothetical protein